MTTKPTPAETLKIAPEETAAWAPPEAPMEMPEQVLQRDERRKLGLRLLALMLPSDA